MRINDFCPTDHEIIPPSGLLSQVYSFTDQPIKASLTQELYMQQLSNEYTRVHESTSNKKTISRKNKRDQQGLKRLMRQQKVKMIMRRFIQKLKLNNANSPPVVFEPYQIESRQSMIYDCKGIQLPDVYQKILSVAIAIYIMVCLFIDTTAMLYPQILGYTGIKVGQSTALVVFLVELVSSCVVVKMVEGKKVYKIRQIIYSYFQDGLFIDLVYLLVLIANYFTEVGNLRLIILLKLPECLRRLERIQNTFINTFYKEQYWGLAKVFLLNFILAHFLSLLLLFMAQIDPENSWTAKMKVDTTAWYQQYIWGYYWGTTIMLTVGFGDISPGNYKQAICVVLIETFSCLALAYNINCVGNLITNLKSQDIEKNKNIKTFKILSNRNAISQNLELKIHNYIEESTNIKKKFNFEEQSKFISTLPNQLKADFLKQSNKKIFQNLVFLRNLTQKTLLALAQAIHMKICHPEQIIKKRGELCGLMILKQGKIGYCTKLNGSNHTNFSIDRVTVKEGDNPYLLSLDFLSLERQTFQVKSEEYSILYFLNMDQTIDTLKTGELDYEHFCFLRDRIKNFDNEYEVFKCEFCESCHTKFDCPKLHYIPLRKHAVDKYLYSARISKNGRRDSFLRYKQNKFKPFRQISNNLKMVDLRQETNYRYSSWKKQRFQLNQALYNLERYNTSIKQSSNNLLSTKFTHNLRDFPTLNEISEKPVSYTIKNLENLNFRDLLKDQISQIMTHNNQVWLVECDELKNFKFYFPSYNASKLSYLNKKAQTKSLFS